MLRDRGTDERQMDQFSTDPPNTGTGDQASPRDGSRDSLLLSARLRTSDDPETTVRVRNLSAGGLMAEYAHPIAIGTPVDIELRGIGWVKGRVAWMAEGRIGIAFERDVNPLAARNPVPSRSARVNKVDRRSI